MFLSFCYIYNDFVRQLKVFPPSFCHFCASEMSPGWGHLITGMDPSVGHLNGILARVGGNLNNNFQKSQMPGGLLKLRFDRYIKATEFTQHSVTTGLFLFGNSLAPYPRFPKMPNLLKYKVANRTDLISLILRASLNAVSYKLKGGIR